METKNNNSLYSEGLVGATATDSKGTVTVYRAALSDDYVKGANCGRLPATQWFVDGHACTQADAKAVLGTYPESAMGRL